MRMHRVIRGECSMKHVIVSFSAIFLITVFCCSRSEPLGAAMDKSSAPSVNAEEQKADDSDIVSSKKSELSRDDKGKSKDAAGRKEGISFFYTPNAKADGRYLEYTAHLSYRTKTFAVSRKTLIGIISKYGYVKSENASGEDAESMNAEIAVYAARLYDVLVDLDAVGALISESIETVDHTETMALSARKSRRETIRMQRRNIASMQVPLTNTAWDSREASLSRSEDALDAADHEQWKVEDAVAWAKVTISLSGPENPERIQIPDYRNAFTGIVNGFFFILYGIIAYLPLLALLFGIGFVIWAFRKKIAGLFQRFRK